MRYPPPSFEAQVIAQMDNMGSRALYQRARASVASARGQLAAAWAQHPRMREAATLYRMRALELLLLAAVQREAARRKRRRRVYE